MSKNKSLDVPWEIVEASIKIKTWAEENDLKYWKIGATCDRRYSDYINTVWKPSHVKAKEGSSVWIIERHWKKIYPQSYAIHAGTVEYIADNTDWSVCQNDEAGVGSQRWYPATFETDLDQFLAWAYADDIRILPEYLTDLFQLTE